MNPRPDPAYEGAGSTGVLPANRLPASFHPAGRPSLQASQFNDHPLEAAKQAAMVRVACCLAATVPAIALLSVYYSKEEGLHYWIRLLMGMELVVGSVSHLLMLRHLSIRAQAWWSVTWLTFASALAEAHLGPTIGGGLSWVLSLLVAVFFLSSNAGIAVVAAYILSSASTIFLVHLGLLPRPEDFAIDGDPLSSVQIHLAGLAVLIVCLRVFRLTTDALHDAIQSMQRQHNEKMEADRARKEAETRMLANQHFEAIGKLAGGVAHDFNNALTIVQCNAELLKLTLSEPDDRARADDILTASRAAAQSTRQLLSLNRRSVSVPSVLRPDAALGEFSQMVRSVLPETVHLKVDLASTRQIRVASGDLHQAILNLVLNARDAMPEGGTIRLRSFDSQSSTGSPQVTVCVSDTGCGISPELFPKIFQPFFTTKAEGKGTGLGLAMVKQFVDHSNGQVWVESTPGHGTRINLAFPEISDAAVAAPLFGTPPCPSNRHVLLVEDESTLRTTMEIVLARAGYRVTACTCVEEALACLQVGDDYDLLCTDGVTGPVPVTELISRFSQLRAQSKILVCSGHLESDGIQRLLEEQSVAFMHKPYTGAELLARLHELASDGPPDRHRLPA